MDDEQRQAYQEMLDYYMEPGRKEVVLANSQLADLWLAIEPFKAFATEYLRMRSEAEETMFDDRTTHAVNGVKITVGDWKRLAATGTAERE